MEIGKYLVLNMLINKTIFGMGKEVAHDISVKFLLHEVCFYSYYMCVYGNLLTGFKVKTSLFVNHITM